MTHDDMPLDSEKILSAIDEYTDAFQRSDMSMLLRYIFVPCMQIRQQNILNLNTTDEVQSQYSNLVRQLKAKGYSHSIWLERNVSLLGPSTAMVSGAAIRYKSDGNELERIGGTYLLRLTEAGWKIAVLVAHPPSAVIRPAPSQ